MIDISSYHPQRKLLANKVILITGSTSGIGREASITFSQFGAKTILLGKNIELLEETYELIVSNNLEKPILHVLDFDQAKEEEYFQLAESVLQEYGKLDGLLNNAGILGKKVSIEDYSLREWRKVLKVNLESGFLLTKSLLPALRKANNSSIVFTSSGVGRKGKAYWGAYSISKFAVEGLVQILAEELENTSNIRVNAGNPGSTRTKMRVEAYPAENPKYNPTPKDIMNAYLYLMGEDSIGCNGKSIDAQ